MLNTTVKAVLTVGLAAGMALTVGCAKKTDTSTSDSTTMARTDTVTTGPQTVDTSTHPAAAPKLTDANILALMGESDSSEVVEAKAVLAKAKSPDVKAFAAMMVADHSKLKKDGEALAKKINIAPQPPANDPVPGELTSTMSMINGATDAHALDSQYIAHAVDDHQKDLTTLQDWKNQAQNADLKAAIDKATPVVQKHLDRSKAIQDKMSKMPAANAKAKK